MKENDKNYINKKECIARGFIRSGRNYYRETLLERLAARGEGKGLDWKINKYSINDRLSCGLELAKDFSRSKISNIPTNDTTRIKVDGGGKKNLSECCLDAEQRFHEAMRSIPHPEIRDIVYKTCIEEKSLFPDTNENSSAKRKKEGNMSRGLLCMGLDFLCSYYIKNKY